MAKKPSNKSTKKNKPAAQSKIQVGNIDIDGSVGGPFVVGNNNVINLPPEQQAFRSLHQLPQPPADFTGRDDLIAQLLADFAKGKGATITGLIGMGGIGKTAVGLVVAKQIEKDYPDAQIFLDLKGTTTPLSAMDVMRHVILSFEPGMDLRTIDEAGMGNTYQSVLHGKRALLFLDNARSAEQIAPLRPPETCALLVTSRWTFGVPGLKNRHVGVMSEENAKKFLLEICSHIGDKASALAKACAYLPLALRIAGSFLSVNEDWKVEKYLAQLNDRKQRLATLHESHEEAELTTESDLLATFELSYSTLSEENCKHWRMLGVFPASFDASAAGAMWKLDPKRDATAKSLGLLLRYSLLDYDETSSRYSLHDLLVDFSLMKMEEEEEIIARISHSVHYSEVLGNITQMYLRGGENILLCLRLYDTEWMNIEAGQRLSARYLEENREATQACNWYAWQGSMNALRLKPIDRIKWIEAGLQAARVLENKEAEAAHLNNLGNAYAELGETRKAIEFYEQRLVIAREIGDRRGEGNALGGLGIAHKDLGDVRKAIEFHEQWLAIAREIGDRRGEGQALGNLGTAYKNLGEVRKAIEFYEQRLVIAREIGDRRGEGNALGGLGSAYYRLGEFMKAENYYSQQIIIAKEIDDKSGEGNAFWGLAICKKQAGDISGAREMFQKALDVFKEIESPSANTMQEMLDELNKKV